MNMYKYFPFMLFISFWLLVTPVSAQTIVYIPMDDRPVNLEYVVDTAQAAGVDIVVPPKALLGTRGEMGDPEGLWAWLFAHSRTAMRLSHRRTRCYMVVWWLLARITFRWILSKSGLLILLS